ncbi:MAG TPA: NACHT domain-containing protein [Puia sp.]|jgi:hypothetical protein|nr:NACHT domain-containing protein [Puia sp.]
MITEVLLEVILDKAVTGSAKYLKEKKFQINSGPHDLEMAISDHLKQIVNWSEEVSFKDLPNSKVTSKIFIDLEVYLMPVKTKMEPSEVIQKISSKKIFKHTNKHFVILGQPGAGKTTLTKFICQSVLTDPGYYPEEFKVPILIRLRDLNTRLNESGEKNPLINCLFQILGLTIHSKNSDAKEEDLVLAKERILIPILEDLKSIVILDGFDEIAERKNKDRVIEDFKRLSLSCNSCRLVLTSRSSDYNYSFENITVLEICPLTPGQIEEFAGRWLEDANKVKDFLIELKKSPFLDTAIRPLTIGHLCAIYERSGKIPDKPKTVYRKIINLLLEEWDEQRGIRRLSQYGTFELDRKFEFLCRLSYELTVQYGQTTFSDRNLKTIYNRICGDFDLIPGEKEKVIAEIEGHTGLILEGGYHEYEFAHKSIQEFLCAEHLVKLPVIPDLKTLSSLPNELAIAVTISSNSSHYFVELVLRHFVSRKVGEHFITNFINRLILEKPDFNSSKELGFALIVLYTLFRRTESGQLRLFDFNLPVQFEKFVELIFARNKRLTISNYYDFNKKEKTESSDVVLQLKRKKDTVGFGNYQLPEYLYVKKTFVDAFDEF